jgi:hypothetical protein
MRLNPCIESLKDMKPVEGGRYCASCAKTIVDLTNKSNQEIRTLYDEHNGKLCGIVMPNQLQENKFYHPLKRFALALMIVFGTSLFVFANAHGFNQFQKKAIAHLKGDEVNLTVKGFVFSDQNPLVGAGVVAKVDGKDYIAFTDINGEFQLSLPEVTTGEVTLIISHAGYKTVTKDLEVKDGMTSLFAGRTSLELDLEKCVKGKIAPVEDPEIIPKPGYVMPPEPMENGIIEPLGGEIAAPPPEEQLKGDIIVEPVENPDEKTPSAGGIEAPDIDDQLRFD